MACILAIDTTADSGSLAIWRDGALLEELALHSTNGYGHIVFAEIQRLLERRGVHLHDIDAFAAASGPGSFTGVRIGLAAAKGLAEATQKPVVAVSNLKAMAWQAEGPLRATLLDARRGEVYGAVYSGVLDLVQSERVTKFPAWLDSLPPGAAIAATDFTAFAPSIGGRFAMVAISRQNAAAIAAIAHQELIAGRALDPAGIEANYVRRSDAELLWIDRVAQPKPPTQ